jgi:hypothetical protein
MAHLLLANDKLPEKQKRYTLPHIEGKFGFAIYTGKKDIFIGISVGDVIMETITRKRMVKLQKGTVKTFNFD